MSVNYVIMMMNIVAAPCISQNSEEMGVQKTWLHYWLAYDMVCSSEDASSKEGSKNTGCNVELQYLLENAICRKPNDGFALSDTRPRLSSWI